MQASSETVRTEHPDLPLDMLIKIASCMPLSDLARTHGAGGMWSTAAESAMKPKLDGQLRVAVLDDGDQTHCFWLNPSHVSDGLITYTEPSGVPDVSKEEFERLAYKGWGRMLVSTEYYDAVKRWIHCGGDFRSGTIHLDLKEVCLGDMASGCIGDMTYGSLVLGEGRKMRSGKRITQRLADGTTVVYAMYFNGACGCAGMSWIRVYKISLPIARLVSGVSNEYL
jgi:hypothetical protein